jgi:hypothetical protein
LAHIPDHLRRFVVVGLVALAVGCSAEPHSELLEIARVSPSRLSQGQSVRIEGRGFPERREGTVRLEGHRRTPGGALEQVRYEAPVRAGRDGTVRLPVDARLFAAMGGRATFRGEIRVTFRSSEGAGSLFGSARDVVLDFVPDTGSDLALELDRARRGRAVAQRLGVAIEEEERFEGGLLIASVEDGSVAARLGMTAGDRIVAMDGLRLYGITDLVPPPGIEATVLELVRAGSDVPATVTLPLLVATELPNERELWWIAVMAVLLFVLAFAAPTARLTAALARRPPDSNEGTLAWLVGAPTSRQATSPEPLVASDVRRARRATLLRRALLAFGVIAMSGAFAGVAVAGRVLETSFGVGILLTSSLALRLTARMMDDAPIELSLKLVAVAVIGAPLSISVICICLLVGTGHLAQIHAAQGGLPWQWLVFHHPVAFTLFPVFAATALGRIETGPGIAGVAARGHLLVVSCLGAAIFLGGSNAPFPDLPYEGAQGVLAFVVKCWAFIAAGLWARKMGPGAGAGVYRWAVPLSLLGLCASLAWLAIDVPRFVESACGPLLAALAASMALYVVYQRVARRGDVLRLYPFL